MRVDVKADLPAGHEKAPVQCDTERAVPTTPYQCLVVDNKQLTAPGNQVEYPVCYKGGLGGSGQSLSWQRLASSGLWECLPRRTWRHQNHQLAL
jgi:hypothetical protein